MKCSNIGLKENQLGHKLKNRKINSICALVTDAHFGLTLSTVRKDNLISAGTGNLIIQTTINASKKQAETTVDKCFY